MVQDHVGFIYAYEHFLILFYIKKITESEKLS